MKRLFVLTASLLMLCVTMSEAQVKINWDGPSGFNFKFKRCFTEGQRCVIDFLVTNNTSSNVEVEFDRGQVYIYDDEGNVYDYQKVNEYKVGNGHRFTLLPYDTPVKGRIVVDQFDEYATRINVMRLGVSGMGKYSYVEFRNIPVTRE